MTEYPPYLGYSGLAHGVYTNLGEPPEGFEWVHGQNQWLFLRDEFGRFYYVKFQDRGLLLIYRARAGLWDWIWSCGRIKPGSHYADYHWTIFLPKKHE